MKKLNFKGIDLKYQRVTEWQHGFVHLLPDSLLYSIKFYGENALDREDMGLGFGKPTLHFSRVRVRKENVTGWYIDFLPESKCWKIEIFVAGTYAQPLIFYKSESEALNFCTHIDAWLYGEPLPYQKQNDVTKEESFENNNNELSGKITGESTETGESA